MIKLQKAKKKKRIRIPWYRLLTIKIVAIHLFSVIVGVGLIFFLTDYLLNSTIGKQTKKRAKEEIALIIETIKNTGKHLILKELQHDVQKAIDVCRLYYSEIQQGTHTQKEAQKHVTDYLAEQRIAEEGYFVVVNSKADIIFHPVSELIGTNQWDYDVARRQATEKTGYFEYMRQNPQEKEARKKVLYMDYFAPWDWIIAATAYKEEYNALLEEKILSDMLSAIIKNNKVLITVETSKNKPIVTRNSLDDFFADAKDILSEIKYGESREYIYKNKKYFIIKERITDLDWHISMVYNLENLQASRSILMRIAALSLFIILLISLMLTAYIYFKISRPINKALPVIALATKGKLNLRLKPRGNNELTVLARDFNKLMDSLVQNIQEKNKAIAQASFLSLFPQENPNPVIFINKDIHIGYANKTAARIFSLPEGYCNEELPDELKEIEMHPGKSINIKKDNRLYEFLPSPISKFDGMFYFGRDITREKEYEKNLLIYKWLFEHAFEGMTITDEEGTIEQVNPSFTSITGYTRAEAIGKNPRILKSEHHPPEFYTKMWNDLITKGVWADEIWNRRKNGEVYPEWLSIFRIKDSDNQIHYIGIFHDISNQKSMEERLRHMAYHDALTGLPNRSLLNDRLKKHIANARRTGSQLAVVFIDMDNFKGINDTFGHKAGDLVLKKIADILRRTCREIDTVARISGDEFAIVLPDLNDRAFAIGVVKRIFKAAADSPMEYKSNSIPIGLSAGIAFYPDDGKTEEELLSHSDMALYRAKNQGKNRYAIFNEADQNIVSRQLETFSFLREDIENNTLSFLWKPWCSPDGDIKYLESTLRCKEAGYLNTRAILDMAEQINVSEELGKNTIKHVALLIEELMSHNNRFPNIVIRLPYSIVFSNTFSDDFIDLCKDAGIGTDNFFFLFSSPVVRREKTKEAYPYIYSLMEKGLKGSLEQNWGIYIAVSKNEEGISPPFERLPNRLLVYIKRAIDANNMDIKNAMDFLIGLKRYPDKKVVITDLDTEEDAAFARKIGADLLAGNIICPPVSTANIKAIIKKIK